MLKSLCGENLTFNVVYILVFVICFKTNHVQIRKSTIAEYFHL